MPSSSSSPPAPAPTPPSPIDARLRGAGFGGVGPWLPPGVPNAWAAALIEVTTSTAELSGVRVVAISLLDAQGNVLALASGPFDPRVAPSSRARYDFSEDGTTPFTGTVARNTTLVLRVRAPLDRRLEELRSAGAETRVRIEIADANGGSAVIEGRASQWPTG